MGRGAGNLDEVGSSAEADMFFTIRHAVAGAKGAFHGGISSRVFFSIPKR
jgi:hypothetical protein